jgi:hypothetical protein
MQHVTCVGWDSNVPIEKEPKTLGFVLTLTSGKWVGGRPPLSRFLINYHFFFFSFVASLFSPSQLI